MRKDFGDSVPTFGKQAIGHAIEGGRVNGTGGIVFRTLRHRDVLQERATDVETSAII